MKKMKKQTGISISGALRKVEKYSG